MNNIRKIIEERLKQLEIESRNNEKVVADGVKLMNRNLGLQSRLEALEKENKELLIKNNSLNIINTINQENIKNYLKEIVDYKNKCINQIQENEKLKKAIIDILEYIKCELDSIEIVDRIENILKEVLGE